MGEEDQNNLACPVTGADPLDKVCGGCGPRSGHHPPIHPISTRSAANGHSPPYIQRGVLWYVNDATYVFMVHEAENFELPQRALCEGRVLEDVLYFLDRYHLVCFRVSRGAGGRIGKGEGGVRG